MKLIVVGKSKDYAMQIEGFAKRIRRFAQFEIITVKDSTKEKEAGAILDAADDAYLVALDEHGTMMTSIEFSDWLAKMQLERKDIVFCTGGPDGLAKMVLERADRMLSLSVMTLPHELAQLVFVEQLYRALSIKKGLPYHRK